MARPTVEIEGVCKSYNGKYAVHELTLGLMPGECVALVGHNGAGKTSLMKLLLGLTHRESGGLRVLDADPGGSEAVALRRRIGFLPETIAFHPAMTGLECLAFYARLKGVPVARNEALFARVGLGLDAAGRKIASYSKGMRQRLGLAQALLGAPCLLLLDEPTTGLDPALRLSFYRIVRELRDSGATILLCSHALTELEGQADRVVVMDRGRKIAEGNLDALRALANLPVHVTLTLETPDRALAICARYRLPIPQEGGCRVTFSCARSEKLALMRDLLAEEGVGDLEATSPSLDAIYAHFLSSEAAA